MKLHPFRVCVIVVAAFAMLAASNPGCRSNLGRAIHDIKELEPKAKQRNEDIRKLTGAPDDKNE